MKAQVLVRHGLAASAFEMRDMPDPVPKAGELRINSEVSGLNFADVMARLGLYQDAPPLPSVLGYEVVGRIDAIGSGIKRFQVGQRVVAFTRFGGYASSVIATEDSAAILPDDYKASAAAALATQYVTAYFAAEEMVRLHKGDHVLIQAAAGGVGTALVQLCKRAGCVVYGTASSEEKLKHLRDQGVDHPINYREADFAKEFLKLSGGRKADVVFDSLGGASFRRALKLLSAGGRMVGLGMADAVGGQKGGVFRTLKTVASFGILHPAWFLIHSKAIVGVNMLRVADQRPDIIRRCLQAVTQLAVSGEVSPVVGGEFRAEEIGKAHDFLGARKSIGKVVIRWN